MAIKYTEEQLNSFDKSLIIQLFLDLQEQSEALTKEVHELNNKMQLIMEQLVLSNKSRFGRSSEKMDDPNQMSFTIVDGEFFFFNEAEALFDPLEPEPDALELKPARKPKSKGKKEEDIKALPVNIINHHLTEDELIKEFGENNWKQLPDEIAKRYKFIPAKVEIDEHHIGVYVSKVDDHFVKAPHPKGLLRGSLVSPSIGAALMNAKYINAAPLARLEREFERYGLAINRKVMANWMIRLGEEYLAVMYDYLHELLYYYHVIQADETPVLVNRDGRPAGSKSWMWVYRSGHLYKDKQIVLYDYQKHRNASHPLQFLKDYKGVCVTDGYQVYHSIEKKLDEVKIAGCWVHMRRKFNDAKEVLPKEARSKSLAHLIMKQIQAIYREEGKLNELTASERLSERQVVIKPLVDALFAYLKVHECEAPSAGKLREAFTYALNQEKYLRVFLEDGEVPLDNNASERAIRGFCIGKHNWQVIDTINGAKSSAIIYSIAETAKANNLKPYEYFEFLLENIPEHMDDKNRSFLEDLLPWSPSLPEKIRKSK